MLIVQILNIDKSIAILRSFNAESMNNKETIHLYRQFTLGDWGKLILYTIG
jgi:hypothetical protein